MLSKPTVREIYPCRLEREVEPELHQTFKRTRDLVEAEHLAKIEVLRAQIASGEYRPDPELIAERMLAALCPSLV